MLELYRKYYKLLMVNGLKFIHDPEAVHDIVIDSIMKVHEKGYTGNAQAILMVTVKRRCLNYIRLHKSTASMDDAPDLILDTQSDQDLMEIVKSVLNENVSKASRMVIVMYYIEGKTFDEIERLLHKNRSTIRSLKHYGMGKLKYMANKKLKKMQQI